jgi:quercetin dioxygenase-like cupin family protein
LKISEMLLALTLCVTSSCGLLAQEAGHSLGPVSKVEIDNDQVQVLRMRLAPHATTPLHTITARVVVWITDANLQLTAPDGTKTVERHKAGESGWVPGGAHVGTNLGDRPIEFIAIIPKSPRR